jgi:protein-S-isoprenylcysteine O-methyltransferase Ste14
MQQDYREPEYKVRATWALAWGLLWRMWLICVPFYAAAAIFGAIGK